MKKSQGNYQTTGGTVASTTITIEANKTGIQADDADTFATATVSGSTVSPGTQRFFIKLPVLALATASVTALTAPSGSTTPQQADVKIRLNVTATAGDIYVPKYSSTYASSGIVASMTPASGAFSGDTITSNADDTGLTAAWVVRAGDTKYFEYSVVMGLAGDAGNTAGESMYANVVDFKWGTTESAALNSPELRDYGVSDFKTGAIFIQAP